MYPIQRYDSAIDLQQVLLRVYRGSKGRVRVRKLRGCRKRSGFFLSAIGDTRSFRHARRVGRGQSSS
jgi:hypothetical protein